MCLLLKNLETVQIQQLVICMAMYRICRVPNLHKVPIRVLVLTLNPTELKRDQLLHLKLAEI